MTISLVPTTNRVPSVFIRGESVLTEEQDAKSNSIIISEFTKGKEVLITQILIFLFSKIAKNG